MNQVAADITSSEIVKATDLSTTDVSSPSTKRVANSSTSNKGSSVVLLNKRIMDEIEKEKTSTENVKVSSNFNTIVACSGPSTQAVTNSSIPNEDTISNILSAKKIKNERKVENERTLTEDLKASSNCNMINLIPEPRTQGVTDSSTLSEYTRNMLSDQQTESMNSNGYKKAGNIKVKNLEDASTLENLGNSRVVRKETISSHDAIVDMIKNSIINLKKADGASFIDISKYMEETYQVNMNTLKYCVSNSLKECVDSGVLEKISELDGNERFKIKESIADITEGVQNLHLKDENLKHSLVPESGILDVKAITPFRDMVINMIKNSIKNLKKRNGASFEDISKYMEERYEANMTVLKYCVKNNLNECLDSGVLEKVSGVAGEERFKIKE